MPRAEPEERLRKLKEKQARVNAEIQRTEARQREAERKRETRRLILLGSMALDQVARGQVTEQVFKARMDRFLRRPQDRALFDLPPPAFQRIQDLRAEGKSLRRIAAILAAARVPFPPGCCKKWNHKVVARLLRQLEGGDTAPAATEEGRHGNAE